MEYGIWGMGYGAYGSGITNMGKGYKPVQAGAFTKDRKLWRTKKACNQTDRVKLFLPRQVTGWLPGAVAGADAGTSNSNAR